MQLVRVDRDPYTMRGPVVRFDAMRDSRLTRHDGTLLQWEARAELCYSSVAPPWRAVHIVETVLAEQPELPMLCVERVRRALLNGAP